MAQTKGSLPRIKFVYGLLFSFFQTLSTTTGFELGTSVLTTSTLTTGPRFLLCFSFHSCDRTEFELGILGLRYFYSTWQPYLLESLVYWLWEKTCVQEVMGLNHYTINCMDIFTSICCKHFIICLKIPKIN